MKPHSSKAGIAFEVPSKSLELARTGRCRSFSYGGGARWRGQTESAIPQLRRLRLCRLFVRRSCDGFSPTSRHGRIIIFRILVVIIFGERCINEVKNDARNIYLPAVKQLERFANETGRSVRKAHDKESGVNLGSKTRGVIGRENGRAVNDDVIVRIVDLTQQCIGRFAQEMLAWLRQCLTARQNEEIWVSCRHDNFAPVYFLFKNFAESDLRGDTKGFANRSAAQIRVDEHCARSGESQGNGKVGRDCRFSLVWHRAGDEKCLGTR